MNSKVIYSSIMIAGAMLATCVFSSNTKASNKDKVPPQAQVLSLTSAVTIPEEVTFASETTKLDRYDLYERYDREINSFTYYHSSTLMLIKKAKQILPYYRAYFGAKQHP